MAALCSLSEAGNVGVAVVRASHNCRRIELCRVIAHGTPLRSSPLGRQFKVSGGLDISLRTVSYRDILILATEGGRVAMLSIFDVADYFLHLVDVEAGGSMTPLKLQKMCYYAQAWHAAIEDRPLFPERYEAWIHGPVSPELYQHYREYEYNTIPVSERADFSCFPEAQRNILDEVWDVYGRYDAKYLENQTHEEAPWLDARRGYGPEERGNSLIPVVAMGRYYKEVVDVVRKREYRHLDDGVLAPVLKKAPVDLAPLNALSPDTPFMEMAKVAISVFKEDLERLAEE